MSDEATANRVGATTRQTADSVGVWSRDCDKDAVDSVGEDLKWCTDLHLELAQNTGRLTCGVIARAYDLEAWSLKNGASLMIDSLLAECMGVAIS